MSIDVAAVAARALSVAQSVTKDAEISVGVSRYASANVRFARNEPTTSGESEDEVTVDVTIALGQRQATAAINQADDASLRSLAERALAMAKLAPVDPEHMPLLKPQTYRDVPSAWDDALASMGPNDRAALAERAIAKADAAKVVVAGFFQREGYEHAIAASSGLVARHRSTTATYTVTARTPEGTGSGWAGRDSGTRAGIDDEALSQTAIDKALRSAAAKAIPPGKYTVILEPQAVYELLAFMTGEMDQRSADEGRSFFTNKVGQKLFPESISLRSDPADPLTPGAAFDAEGTPLASHPWIVEGRVQKLECSRFWAQKKGLEATGHQSVFHLSGGTANDVDELVRGTKRGLLVTRLYYNRMLDPQTVTVTGLTRDGLFLIENGKIAGPVTNFRYNESPIRVLKNMEAMTRTTVRVSGDDVWHVPAIRTREFTMASPSAAI